MMSQRSKKVSRSEAAARIGTRPDPESLVLDDGFWVDPSSGECIEVIEKPTRKLDLSLAPFRRKQAKEMEAASVRASLEAKGWLFESATNPVERTDMIDGDKEFFDACDCWRGKEVAICIYSESDVIAEFRFPSLGVALASSDLYFRGAK